uniref:Uncharacterized protein n=1 Tax=Myoviridae sp. ctj3P51 TaxID=2826687 RepID=A0A8S5NPY4_9CAUD|nr:MAG TPA: hypothetical protein [Myoviridae sp. ctj3P51]
MLKKLKTKLNDFLFDAAVVSVVILSKIYNRCSKYATKRKYDKINVIYK